MTHLTQVPELVSQPKERTMAQLLALVVVELAVAGFAGLAWFVGRHNPG